jgi:hypothetical protein
VGPGVNLVHYDPAKVSKVDALEPNPGMIPLAEQQGRRTALDIEFLDLPGERIPLADASVDTGVSTFTLCNDSWRGEGYSGYRTSREARRPVHFL